MSYLIDQDCLCTSFISLLSLLYMIKQHTHTQIGQFFRGGVSLDRIRKLLILPGKEPIPIQRKPLWAFMERERGDSTNFCWVAMNPGYQGEGLIDGSYFDYLVDDVLSTEFKYKKL